MTTSELEQFIETYGREIYSFCVYLTGSRQEAEDLYQDTFVKAVECRKELDAARSPKSFLLAVAVNLFRNRKRKLAWRERIARMESLDARDCDFSESGEGIPERELLQKEEVTRVRQAVLALAPRYREVILLYYMEERSLLETAEILRIPKGTVKSRLHKARAVLKKELEVV